MKEFKPFRLDPVNHALLRVTESGEVAPVAITSKVFDVLRYFVEHPGRLITHEELLEALWPDVAVQPEVLKGHVLAIRTALDDDAHNPRYLETRRGRGYAFIATVENVQRDITEASHSSESMVGREAAWVTLHSLFDRAMRGQAQVVFIRGEAGIGKTTLVENFCADVGKHFALVSQGRCIEGFAGVEPFYPVIEAMARMARDDGRHRVQDALVTHAPSWATLLGGILTRERRTVLQRSPQVSAKSRVLGEFCDFIETLSQSSPVLLWMDDIHWADHSTLDLVSAFSRRRMNVPVMLISTMRSDGLADEPSPARRLIQDLQLHQLCKVINLDPLNEQDVARYIGAGRSAPTAELAASLRRRSGGNPLFLHVILEHLRSIGALELADGQWIHRVPLSDVGHVIPPTIQEAIESKIETIDADSRRVLEAASAMGDTFNAVAPAAAAGMSARRFEDICEALCRSGTFIRQQPPAGQERRDEPRLYKFRHSLYRDVFLARQGPLRLAQSHALIAQEMESHYLCEDLAHAPFELAEQFANAHEWSKAIAYLRVALKTAKRRFAHHDALTILDKAAQVAANVPEGSRPEIEAEILEDRASIYAASHDPRALDAFTRLAAMAATMGRTDIQARAEIGCAFALSWTDVAACVERLERAYRLSDDQPNPQLRARIRLATAAWRIWIAGWNREWAHICEENLRPLRNGDDRQITAWGLIEFSMVCLVSSRYREALETMEQNVDHLIRHAIDRPEFNVFRAIWMTHLGRPWVHILLGQWGTALREFDASEALFIANGNRYSTCTLETLRGLLYLLAGDYQAVRSTCVKLGHGKDLSRESHPSIYTLVLPNEKRHCALLAAAADAGLGRGRESVPVLRQLHQDMADRPVVMDWYWQFLLLWTLADTLLAQGELEEARQHADELAARLREMEEGTWQSLAMELRARIAMAQGDPGGAVVYIELGLAIVEGIGAPATGWRVHRVASEVYERVGKAELALHQQRACQNSAQRLLESMPADQAMAMAFRRMLGASA